MANESIVIFDGVCALCNKSVNFLIKIDKKRVLKYTSIQGNYVRKLDVKKDIDSIIFYKNQKTYYKSTAILQILITLKGFWYIAYIFFIIPPFLRDYLYDIVARYRYIFFAKKESCRIISHHKEKELFLD